MTGRVDSFVYGYTRSLKRCARSKRRQERCGQPALLTLRPLPLFRQDSPPHVTHSLDEGSRWFRSTGRSPIFRSYHF